MQDMDEEKTFSRALISFVKYDNPKTIMHPMLIFVLDILWDQLVPWRSLMELTDFLRLQNEETLKNQHPTLKRKPYADFEQI